MGVRQEGTSHRTVKLGHSWCLGSRKQTQVLRERERGDACREQGKIETAAEGEMASREAEQPELDALIQLRYGCAQKGHTPQGGGGGGDQLRLLPPFPGATNALPF